MKKEYKKYTCTGAIPGGMNMQNKDTRYAYEWFMREEDERYWRQTKKLVEKEKKKVMKIMATLTSAVE